MKKQISKNTDVLDQLCEYYATEVDKEKLAMFLKMVMQALPDAEDGVKANPFLVEQCSFILSELVLLVATQDATKQREVIQELFVDGWSVEILSNAFNDAYLYTSADYSWSDQYQMAALVSRQALISMVKMASSENLNVKDAA
jgi:hypothetical protein